MKHRFFNLETPIIQAPMAGGITSPELVAAVSNAGALGSLGAGYMQPEEIRKVIRQIKSLTKKPFNVNLFVPESEHKDPDQSSLVEILKSLWRELSDEPFDGSTQTQPSFAEQVQVLLEESVPFFSFTFGIPDAQILKEFKKQGTVIIGTATTPDEAEKLEEAGMDAIVCQGYEAGGHRGTFTNRDPYFSLFTLLPLAAKRVKLPLIAAGGIMNGRLGASAMLAGASAIQMGTAFITVKESQAAPAYKQVLMNGPYSSTCITKVVSGKPARAIENELIDKLEGSEVASYPKQHYMTQKLRALAAKKGEPEYMFLLAGQGYPLCGSQTAAELVKQIQSELECATKSEGQT